MVGNFHEGKEAQAIQSRNEHKLRVLEMHYFGNQLTVLFPHVFQRTPLMLACSKSHIEIVERLLQYGAQVGRLNKDGWNSFHIAARYVQCFM